METEQRRPKLNRAERRYNYALAVVAVTVVLVLTLVSPQLTMGSDKVPVLVVAVLAGAFLFGLGQMVIGIYRRQRYLRSLPGDESRPVWKP